MRLPDSEHRRLRNIRRDPRVALSVEAGTHIEVDRIGGVGPWAG